MPQLVPNYREKHQDTNSHKGYNLSETLCLSGKINKIK